MECAVMSSRPIHVIWYDHYTDGNPAAGIAYLRPDGAKLGFSSSIADAEVFNDFPSAAKALAEVNKHYFNLRLYCETMSKEQYFLRHLGAN